MVDAAAPVRVLYVDAFESGRSPLPALERVGNLDVTVARTGAEGRERVGEGFDAVLCGTELPDESGVAWCEDVRAEHAVPVVLVGPEPAAEHAEAALAAGAAEYVPRSLLSEAPELAADRLRRVVDADGDGRRDAVESLPLPVVIGDERVHYANDAAREALSEGGDIVGRPLADLFADDPPEDGSDRRRVAATGEEKTIRTVSLPDTALSLSVLFDGTAGGAAEGLVRKANMLDSILEGIPLAVYFKDREGRHLAVSDFLPQMNPNRRIVNPEGKVHHTTEDIIGKTDFDLYPSDLAEETAADEQEIMETGEPLINKIEHTHTPEDDMMRLSTSKAPWYGPDGEIRGIVGITIDITDEKRYEDAVDYQRSVLGLIQSVLDDEIAAGVAEIDGIAGELPADSPVAEELATTVTELGAHVDVVGTLLGEGQQEFATELADIEQLARAAWEGIETGDATMDVTYNGIIRAEPEKVTQLFTELFENAVVHGGEAVHVTVEQFEDGFFVADDGPGIPPGERPRVFEYGYTTDEDRIGSGLTVAETVASSLDWDLTLVESADGGCRFEVTGVVFE